MLHAFQQAAGHAVFERIVLLVNHVLASEPQATRRLIPHVGRCIELRLNGWPSLLPPWPALVFRITPAGLVDWIPDEAPVEPDLRISLDASNPARIVAESMVGRRPQVDIAGDAQFAADVSWLIDNLRWDMTDDLARVVGQGPAREIARFGAWLAQGLRDAVAQIDKTLSRMRSGVAGRDDPPAR